MRGNYARLDEVLTECYLIGKWENGDVDQRKFTNSCGRFLLRRTRKKPQKLLMIPGGTSFLFRSDFFLFFRVKFWSIQRGRVEGVVDPGLCCIFHYLIYQFLIYHHYLIHHYSIYYYSIYSTSRCGFFISLFIDISKY